MRKAYRCVRPTSSLVFAQSFSTKVFAWGSGHSGVLGQGSQIVQDGYEPVAIQGLPEDVSGVGAGYFHSLAWTSDGDLYTWGRLLESQLGRKTDRYEIDFSATPSKALGKEDIGSPIVFATGSGVATFAVTEDGRLFVAGSSKRGQLGLGNGVQSSSNFQHVSLPGRLLSVACGWGHAAAVVQPSDSSQSRVFTWGWPANNRLGYVSKELATSQTEEYISSQCVWLPQPVPMLDDVAVTKVICGMDSTYCLSMDGQLFSFGDNSHSQLGRVRTSTCNQSEVQCESTAAAWKVPFSHLGGETSIADVSAGVYHCIAITDDYSLITWGGNSSGQLGLGLGCTSESTTPTCRFQLNTGAKPLLGAGRVHSVLLTASSQNAAILDECYAWGGFTHGRLGTSATEDESEVTRVEFFDGLELLDLAVGLDHSMVLVKEN